MTHEFSSSRHQADGDRKRNHADPDVCLRLGPHELAFAFPESLRRVGRQKECVTVARWIMQVNAGSDVWCSCKTGRYSFKLQLTSEDSE